MSDFKKFCIDEKLSPVQIVGARKAWKEQQAIIDNLKAQLNNMEACYIEKKEQVEDVLSRIEGLMVHAVADYENTKSTSMMCAVQEVEKALRGEHE